MHASLLSGLFPTQHRVENMRGDRRLNRRLVTLPEALGRVGYETAAFSQNPLFTPDYGMGEGFSHFAQPIDLARSRVRSRVAKRMVSSGVGPARSAGLYLERLLAPEDAFRHIADWMIRRDASKPFFAFANVLAPHFPWVVPPRMLVRARAMDLRYLTRRNYIALERAPEEFNAGLISPSGAHLRMWRRLYDAAIMGDVDAAFGRFVKRAASCSDSGRHDRGRYVGPRRDAR